MKLGFQKDEGWWTVGLHMFVLIFAGILGMWVSGGLLGFRSDGVLTGSAWIGAVVGDQIFHALRDRYLRRRAQT
jgi:hypothetical protein